MIGYHSQHFPGAHPALREPYGPWIHRYQVCLYDRPRYKGNTVVAPPQNHRVAKEWGFGGGASSIETVWVAKVGAKDPYALIRCVVTIHFCSKALPQLRQSGRRAWDTKVLWYIEYNLLDRWYAGWQNRSVRVVVSMHRRCQSIVGGCIIVLLTILRRIQ